MDQLEDWTLIRNHQVDKRKVLGLAMGIFNIPNRPKTIIVDW